MSKLGIVVSTMLAAGVVSAAVLEDFEPGTTYSGAGMIQADPTDAGNQVLHVAAGEMATFIPTDFEGIVSMRVYDFGEIPTGEGNGPRWGVSGGSESAAITIIEKGWMHAADGYGMCGQPASQENWWDLNFFGYPRKGGQWTRWLFDVASDGSITIVSFRGQNYGTVAAMDTIWVSGGTVGEATQGVLIDDITFQPAAELTPLVLADSDLQSALTVQGGTIEAITDLEGDPGMQIDLSIVFTNGTQNAMHIGFPMGGTEAYEGQLWKIQVVNTNAGVSLEIRQKLVLGDGSWYNGDSVGYWLKGDSWMDVTNTFYMTIPAGGINTAMLMIQGNSTWGNGVVVDGKLPTSIQIVGPLPVGFSPIQNYMLWAETYGQMDTNTTAALGYDGEPDGMDNLLEYALGGDPTTNDVALIQPVATFLDGDTWEYVYKRYRDAADRQLTYDLQTKGDLLSGSWTSSSGMYETGTNTTDALFDVVTNTVTGLANEMFIKLEITENF